MSVRTETLQLRVLVDGSPARRELAQMDQEYAKLNSSLKDLKKNSTEWKSTMERMDVVRERQAELRKEIGDTALTAKQLSSELSRLQVIQRNTTPNTAQWAENARRIEEVKQRLRELNDVNARAAAAWEVQRKSVKLMDMSLSELRMEAARLTRALDNAKPNTAAWAQYKRDLDAVNLRQKDLTSGMSSFGRAWASVKAQIGGAFAVLGTMFAGDWIMSGIRGFIQGSAQLSDELADVQKATGKTAEEVRALNTELGRINTRTANSELRAIAIGLGQAGEEASAAAVAAIDKINVALGDEFGEGAKEITTTLSTLRNNLGDIKSGNYGEDVGRIGNALNVLGANGMATAPVVSDIANRVAGAARTFDISSGAILGTAATFQELGINVERGSTAYVRILQKIASEPQKFARIVKAAGMDVDLFNQQVNTDMQAAFVTVARAARTAGTSNTEFAAVLAQMELEGIGVTELLTKMGANEEMLAEKSKLASEALTNQASITEEFNTKNNTFGAQLDKLSKDFNSFTASIMSGKGAISEFLSALVTGLSRTVNALREAKSLSDVFTVLATPGGVAQLEARSKAIDALTGKSLTAAQVQRNIIALSDNLAEAQLRGDKGQEALLNARIIALRQRLIILQAEARAAQSAASAADNNADVANTPAANAVVAETDEERKARERREKEAAEHHAKLEEELEAFRERAFQSNLTADERDLRQLDEKHRVEREKLKANQLATEADLLALEQQQATERANLIEAQGEERVKGYSAAAEKIRQATLSAAQRTLEDEMRKWDELIALAKKYGIDSTELEAKRLAAIQALNDKSDKDAAKKFGQKSKEQMEREREAFQQRVGLLQEFGNLANSISGYIDAVRNAEEARADADGVRTDEEKARIAELNEQRKQAALVAIAVQGAAAIANGVASAMAAPNWVVGVTQALATAGIVLGLMAQARALMAQAASTNTATTTTGAGANNVPLGAKGGVFEGPSHAQGGLNVVDPNSGRIVAEVEGGEPWMVLSNAFRRNNPGILRRLMRASATGERLNLGERGGIFRQGPAFNFKTANEAIAMASGGVVSGGRATTTSGKGNGATYSAGTGMRLADDDDVKELLRAIAHNTGATVTAASRNRNVSVSLRSIQEKEAEQSYMKAQVAVKRLK